MHDSKRRYRCEECGWRGQWDEQLTAPDPFMEGETLHACPRCRQIDSMAMTCDEPGCLADANCGTPTVTVYRHTCFQHRPQAALPLSS